MLFDLYLISYSLVCVSTYLTPCVFRFVELASILEPGRPPKIDKAAILVDAVRMVTQLRKEAQKLKDSSSDLQEKIKELKVILSLNWANWVCCRSEICQNGLFLIWVKGGWLDLETFFDHFYMLTKTLLLPITLTKSFDMMLLIRWG